MRLALASALPIVTAGAIEAGGYIQFGMPSLTKNSRATSTTTLLRRMTRVFFARRQKTAPVIKLRSRH